MSRCRRGLLLAVATSVGVLGFAPEPAPAAESSYRVLYDVRISPSEKAARVTLRISDPQLAVRWLRFSIDRERLFDFKADGELELGEGSATWTPPPGGGALRYAHRIDHLRNPRSYDARCTESWALFRGDDLVPPVRVRTVVGAHSESELRLRLPDGWSAVTPYPALANGRYSVSHPDRRFDRPVGWILVGHLGVLRERVAGVHVTLAAPSGQGRGRRDMLAMLRWTLPTLRKIAPLPERMTFVTAGDPMWRGGLSGPGSAYLHADLPLISSDSTSPLLHEVIHVMLQARSGSGGDWIVEGLSEYYSLEALARSRTLSRRRYERALEGLMERGQGVRRVTGDHAQGDETARAVGLLHELDAEIARLSGGEKGLDDVLRALVGTSGAITLESFRAITERVAGAPLDGFFDRKILRPSQSS